MYDAPPRRRRSDPPAEIVVRRMWVRASPTWSMPPGTRAGHCSGNPPWQAGSRGNWGAVASYGDRSRAKHRSTPDSTATTPSARVVTSAVIGTSTGAVTRGPRMIVSISMPGEIGGAAARRGRAPMAVVCADRVLFQAGLSCRPCGCGFDVADLGSGLPCPLRRGARHRRGIPVRTRPPTPRKRPSILPSSGTGNRHVVTVLTLTGGQGSCSGHGGLARYR